MEDDMLERHYARRRRARELEKARRTRRIDLTPGALWLAIAPLGGPVRIVRVVDGQVHVERRARASGMWRPSTRTLWLGTLLSRYTPYGGRTQPTMPDTRGEVDSKLGRVADPTAGDTLRLAWARASTSQRSKSRPS
jgi:hypothetical protein